MASSDLLLYHLMLTGEVPAAVPAEEEAGMPVDAAGAAAAAAGVLVPLQPGPWMAALMEDPHPMHIELEGLFGPDPLAGADPLLAPGGPGGGGGGPPVPPDAGGAPHPAHVSRLTVGSAAAPAAGQGLHADKALVVQGGAAIEGTLLVQSLAVLSGEQTSRAASNCACLLRRAFVQAHGGLLLTHTHTPCSLSPPADRRAKTQVRAYDEGERAVAIAAGLAAFVFSYKVRLACLGACSSSSLPACAHAAC